MSATNLKNFKNLKNSKNEFLNRLRELSVASLDDCISSKYLKLGQPVFENRAVVDCIIFPVDAIISVEYCVDESSCTELVTVGREGFIGISWVSGCDLMHGSCIVRQPGEVLEMDPKAFTKLLQKSPTAKQLCDRYVLYRMASMAQRTACRLTHSVLQRMSQQLLVWEARNGDRSQFQMTNQNLANLLGIHRATASEHLSRLQSLGLITCTHGKVQILNHKQLSRKSCGCYDITKTLYHQLIDAPGRRS